jgi:hypothetical protein
MKENEKFEGILISSFLEKKKLFNKKCWTCYVGGSVGKVWEKGGKILLWKNIAYLVLTHHTWSAWLLEHMSSSQLWFLFIIHYIQLDP